MTKIPLKENQKERLKRLEDKLKLACLKTDISAAKSLIIDLQDFLRPLGQETKLMELKNWLFECAIEANELELAIEGLKGIRQKVSKTTRVHLEATSLLAIAYIKSEDLTNAKLFITEVLKNDKVIRSLSKRRQFRKSIIEKFDEEITLVSMKNIGNEILHDEEINSMALKLVESSTEKNLFEQIGIAIPAKTLNSIKMLDDYAKQQLPASERLQLPSPESEIESSSVGKKLFSAVKKTIYNSLCDKESDIYKTWFNEGMTIVLNKKYITSSVIACLTGFGIGIKAIAASVVALIVKFGIEVYCNFYKPKTIMEYR